MGYVEFVILSINVKYMPSNSSSDETVGLEHEVLRFIYSMCRFVLNTIRSVTNVVLLDNLNVKSAIASQLWTLSYVNVK